MTDAERLARAGLCRVASPADAQVRKKLTEEGAEAAYELALSQLGRDRPAPETESRRSWSPEVDVAALARCGGRLLCPGDPEWPVGLADLDAAYPGESREAGQPFALWVRGAADCERDCRRSVAVVGSRASTPYGGHVTLELAGDLAERGWTIVSGAAYGIDAAAHRGALAIGGCTVAVLAGGVDVAYPRGNDGLLARIADEGLVVSEVPPGSSPMRHRFLQRNRIIAALSRGTVLVEAALRSGALNTVRHATTLGRKVMAVPGPVTSSMSAGCHDQIRKDAILVTRAVEVLEVVGDHGLDAVAHVSAPAGPRDLLDDLTRRVLDAVPARRPASPASIAAVAGVSVNDVIRVIGPLCLHGLVANTDTGFRLTALGRSPAAGAAG